MLPPLRQRKEDIPLLVDHFIQKFNRNNTKQVRGSVPGLWAYSCGTIGRQRT